MRPAPPQAGSARIVAVGALLVISFAGLAIAHQGWRGRVPDEEAGTSIIHAVALVTRGVIPNRATRTDLGPYFPPGTVWLAAPGILLTDDLRAVELAGSSLLYIGAIVGVWLLSYRCFGPHAAIVAAALYAFSDIPLRLADGLWARGHPFFYVWMACLAERWVSRKKGWYLAAAVVAWAAGMYVHLEMTPAIAMLPVIWFVFRPPVAIAPLAAAAVVATVMWMPYLSLQVERNFLDLRAQLTVTALEAVGYDPQFSWCEPEPVIAARIDDEQVRRSLAERVRDSALVMTSTMATRALAGNFLLLALLLSGVAAAVVRPGVPSSNWRDSWLLAATGVLILVTEAALRWFVAESSFWYQPLMWMRVLNTFLLIVAVLWAARDPRSTAWAGPSWIAQSRFLLAALLPPWLILIAFGHERLLGVWSLQAVLIGGVVTAYAQRVPGPALRRLALPLLIVAIAATNLKVLGSVRDFRQDGWSGRDLPGIEAIRTAHLQCP